MHNKAPDSSEFGLPFGAAVYVLEPEGARVTKLDLVNRLGIVVGLKPDTHQIIVIPLKSNERVVERTSFRLAPVTPMLIRAINQVADFQPMVHDLDLLELVHTVLPRGQAWVIWT